MAFLKSIREGIGKRMEASKKEKIYRKAAEGESRRRAQAVYYKARAEQEEKYAQTKAKVEREQKEKRLRASYNKKPYSFGEALGGISPTQPSSQPVRKVVSRRRKRK